MATTEKELTATGAKVTTVVTENEATAAAPDEPAAGKAGWIVVGGVKLGELLGDGPHVHLLQLTDLVRCTAGRDHRGCATVVRGHRRR